MALMELVFFFEISPHSLLAVISASYALQKCDFTQSGASLASITALLETK